MYQRLILILKQLTTYQLGKLKRSPFWYVALVGEDELLTVVICLLDKIKDEVKDMIAYFKTQDIKTIMISGDRKVVALQNKF